MRVTCVILSLAILLSGCYSHTTLTADSPLSAYEVSFRLKDGTFVLSREYQRVEDGYKVEGKLVSKDNKGSSVYSGILLDSQIKEVVTNEFSMAKTIVGALLVGVCVYEATCFVTWLLCATGH